MKLRPQTLLLPLAVLTAVPILMSASGLGAPASSSSAGGQDPASSPESVADDEHALADGMSTINRSMRRLRRQLANPAQNQASLALVVAAQEGAMVCKGLVPHHIEALEGEAKAAQIKGYRLEMNAAVVALLQLERNLLEGDNEAARKTFEALQGIEERGHEAYRSDDD